MRSHELETAASSYNPNIRHLAIQQEETEWIQRHCKTNASAGPRSRLASDSAANSPGANSMPPEDASCTWKAHLCCGCQTEAERFFHCCWTLLPSRHLQTGPKASFAYCCRHRTTWPDCTLRPACWDRWRVKSVLVVDQHKLGLCNVVRCVVHQLALALLKIAEAPKQKVIAH